MAITHIVGQSGRGTGDSNISLAVTMAATPTNGNVLLAVVGVTDTDGYKTVTSIVETNVAWTLQLRVQAYPANWSDSYMNIEIWYGVVSPSASTDVTVNLSAAPNNRVTADIYEYSGMATSSFLDRTASNSGIANQTDTGTTANTTQNDELWIGGIVAVDPGTDQTTPTQSFTLYDGVHEHSSTGRKTSLGYLEKIVAATGAANSGTTVSNSDWTGCIATFKGGAAGGSTVKKGSNLANTMTTMLNSKMLFSACNRFPKVLPRRF